MLQSPIFVIASCVPQQKIEKIAQGGPAMPDLILTKPYSMNQLE